ncbi:uncharacterized protein PV07_00699 [Cladophialophora immunda]|uniref:Beta-lactamase-related domain-containing protein n=1 Tax=Cladophialophora immunda TaxID=569365 RepID=A0A0D2DDW6_9EURO|nr:uncharacterized protein PV07_00699 [Cladophialophora immunda]KIW33884.1 hypothetical protein PV07_00699 [Cladophialophora immunda]OQU94418.1 hypothetical protein CLAIMM_00776 [Cladophialophora immunda]
MKVETQEIDRILQKYVGGEEPSKSLRAAGFVVKDKNGTTLYSQAFGKATFDENPNSFSSDTVCWVASLTKLVTAVCVMQIVEKGLIGLDDDLGQTVTELSDVKILKGFGRDGTPILVQKTKPITLRVLLTHSSGFCYDFFDPAMVKWSAAVNRTTSSATRTLEGLIFPLKFEPGESWMYGVGNDWASRIVEVVSGQSFETYAQEHVFGPLGMKSSTFLINDHPELAKRRAAVAFRSPLTGELAAGEDPGHLDPKQISGGAGLFTTLEDYAKLLGALGSDDRTILSPESKQELFRPQISNPKDLQAFCDGPFHDSICPEFPRGLPVNYTLAGEVNLEDVPGKRSSGSVMWSGYTNPHWWIDRKTGIVGTLFTQILPAGDAVVAALYDELELAMYRSLRGEGSE